MLSLLSASCLSIPNLVPDLHSDADRGKFSADEYDPSKPEFIATASQEEVDRTNARMLAQQIAKLEAHAAKRRQAGKAVSHYESVVESLKSRATMQRSGTGVQTTQSEPNLKSLGQLYTGRRRVESEELPVVDEQGSGNPNGDEAPTVNAVPRCPRWTPVGDLNKRPAWHPQGFAVAYPSADEGVPNMDLPGMPCTELNEEGI